MFRLPFPDPPEPASLNPKLPRALNRLILEMIAKRPDERPTAEETAQRLAAIRSSLTAGRPLMTVRVAPWVLVAVTAAAGLLVLTTHPRGRVDLLKMNIRPLASEPGLESNPSISPDGLWIACLYRAHLRDRPQFQVHATAGGPAAVIDTRGLVIEEPAAWSPDSRELAFVGRDQTGRRRIYRASRTGGHVSAMAECNGGGQGSCGVDWSPDGHSLAISETLPSLTSSDLFVADLATRRHRRLVAVKTPWLSDPHFSPDGKWVAFRKMTAFTTGEICIVPAAGGAVRCITHGPWFLSRFGWSSDGRSLIAIAAHQAEKPEIWHFPFDGRSDPYRMASFDLGQAQEITVARRKGTLAWVRDLSASSFWRMPLKEPGRPAELLASYEGIEADAEWSSKGRMVFRSDRTGWSEIWIARADGSGQKQATRFRGPFVGDPHWSPDGRQLAFTAYPDGNADIFTMACDGEGPEPCGSPKRLTRSPATDANPTWSSDGRWIYFSSNRSGRFEVWRIAAAGGELVRITWNGGYLSRESADGKWLYYSKVEHGNGFWRIALPAGGTQQHEEALIPDTPFRAAGTWTLGRSELYYYPSEKNSAVPFPSVRALNLETRRVRDLPVGNTLLGRGLSLSPDGQWLLRTQSDRLLSVIMIAE
jgi:Tol biopolymer transport system component